MTNLPLPTRLAIHRLARLSRDPARRDAIDADLGTRHGRSLFIWILDGFGVIIIKLYDRNGVVLDAFGGGVQSAMSERMSRSCDITVASAILT